MPGGWELAHVEAHVGALLAQLVAAALWWRSPRPAGVSETCTLVLAGGDVLGLAGPLSFPNAWAELGWGWAVAAAQVGVIGRCWSCCSCGVLLTPEGGTREGSEGA
ncbi:hypothetical protein WMF45_34640 [Sorangium sp. So ce448]|uniref:hypothetical protein n=1 Tax=Sorangium sp. So ce448 TaxID=3133314 RepID=UPI003F633249